MLRNYFRIEQFDICIVIINHNSINEESNSKPQSMNIVCMCFSGFLKTYLNLK